MKLFSKTLLLIVTLFAVIATAISVLSARNLYRSLTDEYRSKGIAIAQAVVDSGAEILLTRDLVTVQATIDQFAEISGVAYVFVTSASGEIVAHTFVPAVPREMGGLIEQSRRVPAAGANHATTILEVADHGDVIHISEPILAGVAGFVHVGMDLGYIRAQIWSIVIKQQVLMLAIFLVVAGMAWFFVRRVSQPLTQLAEYTGSLTSQDFAAGLEIPARIVALPGKSRDEIGQLAASFLAMQGTLQQYISELKTTTASKERIESELNIAHDIQMSLVPKTFPPFPDRHEFELHAALVSAREVGGDFYDFFFTGAGQLCFAIGDVSGKGVPASLFMALTKTLLRATGGGADVTAQSIMERLNAEISRDNESCMFVTVFCAVLDIHTGVLDYCNAGHNLPLVIASGEVRELEKTGDVALGMSPVAVYHSARCKLAPGDTVLLYTDGVTEAMNQAQQQFSLGGLKAVLHDTRHGNCQAMVDGGVAAVHAFAGSAEQSDDMTLLALRYHGPEAIKDRVLSAVLNRELPELQRLNSLWEQVVTTHQVPAATAFRIRLAFEELVTNAISHGRDAGGLQPITVSVDLAGELLTVVITDPGPAFNPLEAPEPDTHLALEQRQPGGLGLHLVRTMMDDFQYRREHDTNVVILKTSFTSN